jgi:5'-methylthioadenosine/S-adenosylhomocysteine nucleosidase
MIAILSALQGETASIVEALQNPRTAEGLGEPIVTGALSSGGASPRSQELVVASTGVGKAMAAMSAEYLISRFAPDAVVMVGLAGALSPALRIGDLILATDTLQYDLDASPLGFAVGEVPYAGYRLIPSDPALLEAAVSFAPPEGKLHRGRILTGDRFVADAHSRERLVREFEGDAVEMEGAAVGLVCLIHRVPFLLARTISDTADGEAPKSFNRFLARASRQSAALVRHLADLDLGLL